MDISKSIKALKEGNIIIYPTDTLYALGANIYDDEAVEKIFRIKKRPFDNPLPVAVANINEIKKIAITNEKIIRITNHFLPGTLTLVLHKKNKDLDIVTSSLDKIAIRIPDNDIALDLLSKFGPLTVTSANIHNKKTPHFIKEIKMEFSGEDIAVYLDYGKLDGEPSTIVDLTSKKPRILRKGTITEKDILDAI